jgi:hypothetical protein
LARVGGQPGHFQEALDFLEAKAKESNWMYGQCVLFWDGMSIMKHTEWSPSQKQEVGFVDLGYGPIREKGEAGEALVFMAGSLLGNWKIPLGYILVNGKCFIMTFTDILGTVPVVSCNDQIASTDLL